MVSGGCLQNQRVDAVVKAVNELVLDKFRLFVNSRPDEDAFLSIDYDFGSYELGS